MHAGPQPPQDPDPPATNPAPAHSAVGNGPQSHSNALNSTTAEEAASETALGLRSSDRLFVAAMTGVIVLLVLINLIRLQWRGEQLIEIDRLAARQAEYRIDINNATWVEWAQLPGIGEATARKIVEDRDINGPFTRRDDVQRVKGIGKVTYEKIRHFLLPAEGETP